MDLPPIVAVFLVVFDQRKGYTIAWQQALPGIDLDGVEYRSLPSGLHAVQEDVVYFRHGEYIGASVFVRGDADEAHRNANFAAVGVLVPQYGALGQVWLHVEELRILAKDTIEKVDNIQALEHFWTAHKSRDKAGHSSKKRKRGLSDTTSGGFDIAADVWPKDHPALAVPDVLDTFGPLLFPLHRAALARQRVLLMGSAPVQETENALYITSVLATVPDSLIESLPTAAEFLSRPLPLFNIGIHDITTLPTGEDGNGWLACTTDDILGEKPELWDMRIDMPSRMAHSRSWPMFRTSDGRIVKASQRDLRRWNLLKRELRRLRHQIGGSLVDSGSMRSSPESDQRPLLERRNTTGSAYDIELTGRNDADAAEAPTWTSVAYRGFMWWASAGDASAWENEESKADEEMLFDMPDLGALSPEGSGRYSEDSDAEYARAAATLLVAYFRRVTEATLRTMAGAVEQADDATEEGVEEDEIQLSSNDLRSMGLDSWSAADTDWVKEMMKVWFGRAANVSDAGMVVCGVRIC